MYIYIYIYVPYIPYTHICDPIIIYITPPYDKNTLGQPEFVIGFLKPG